MRDTKLSMNLRDLKAAYLPSPHFRDIYLNLTQNKVPLGKGAAKRLEQNARNYMLLDGLLFKIIEFGDGRLDSVVHPNLKSAHLTGHLSLQSNWGAFWYYKVLPNYKSEILLSKFG